MRSAPPIWREPFYPQLARVPGFGFDDQATRAAQAACLAAARVRARRRTTQTGNPLWGYALAQLSSDPADLGRLASAEAAALSGREDVDDRRVLAALLRAQRVRILLMSGQRDAAARLQMRRPQLAEGSDPSTQPSPTWFVRQGGLRFLLGEPRSGRSALLSGCHGR